MASHAFGGKFLVQDWEPLKKPAVFNLAVPEKDKFLAKNWTLNQRTMEEDVGQVGFKKSLSFLRNIAQELRPRFGHHKSNS